MAKFEPALYATLESEGVKFDEGGNPIVHQTGYHNLASDRGKETNFGIIKATAVGYGYTGELADIPFATVQDIYRTLFWNKVMGDDMKSQAIAEEMFDAAVNCVPVRAVRFLQTVLNHLNNEAKKWVELTVDGIMGPRSLATLHQALALGEYYEEAILIGLNGEQWKHYAGIVEKHPGQEVNLLGWTRRCKVRRSKR